jgi:transcription-repair coupling factor (superfamily II helicase)
VSHRKHPIIESLAQTPVLAELRARLPRGGERLAVGGCIGSAASALLATIHETHPNRIFVALAHDPESAARLQADLESLLDAEAVHLFPQSETRFYSEEDTDLRIEGLRIEAIEALLGNHARLFVATPRALQERMAIPDHLARLRLHLAVGEEVGFSILVEELETMGYTRVPLAEETGHFAVRGGLLDIFS